MAEQIKVINNILMYKISLEDEWKECSPVKCAILYEEQRKKIDKISFLLSRY